MFHYPSLQQIVNEIKRLQGKRKTRKRLSVNRKVLANLISQFDQSTKTGTTLHATFCLAFAAFLQYREFIYIARKCQTDNIYLWHLIYRSIAFQNDHITLLLSSSKINLFCQGVTLIIAKVDNLVYIVAYLWHLYKYFPELLFAPFFTISTGSFIRDYVTSRL